MKKLILTLTLAIAFAINGLYAQGMLDRSKIHIMNQTLKDKTVKNFHEYDPNTPDTRINTYSYTRLIRGRKPFSANYTYFFNEQNICQKYAVKFPAANLNYMMTELKGYKAVNKTGYETSDGKRKAELDKNGNNYTLTFKLQWSTL